MKQPMCVAFLLFSSLLLLCPSAISQSLRGVIRGTVTDPSGAVIPAAEVIAVNLQGEKLSVFTDELGSYSIEGLTPGVYRIVISVQGFQDFERNGLEIVPGIIRKLDVQMEIQAEGETVVVPEIEEKKGAGTILSGQEVENLPDSPDQLESTLRSLAAQTGGQGKIQIYVNGFPSDTLPPKSSIAEIRVNQDPYSAEYSGAGNGRIEIITKPGTDNFHGQVSVVGTDSALNANNALAESNPSYYSAGTFVDLGGALSKSASYHIDGGYVNFQHQSVVNAIVLDPQFAPVSVNQVVGTGSVEEALNPQLDLEITPKLKLTTRYEFARVEQPNTKIGGLDLASQGLSATTQTQTLQVGGRQIWSEKAVNESRFQFSRSRLTQTAVSSAPTLSVEGSFTGGGNSLGDSSNEEARYRFRDTFSLTLKKHHLFKFGGDVNRDSTSNVSDAGFNGDFIFSSLAAYQITEQGLAQGLSPEAVRKGGGGASLFSISAGDETVAASTTDLTIFGEDTWTAVPDLSLTVGLRLEHQFGKYGRPDFAPRLGFNYGIFGTKDQPAKTRISGGYGWSYTHFQIGDLIQLDRFNGVRAQQYLVNAPDFYPNIPPIASLGTEPAAAASLFRRSSNFRDSYGIESTLELTRDLTKSTSLFATYNNLRTIDQLVTPNINAPLPGTYNPLDPTSGIRPLGNGANIYEYQSEGVTKGSSLAAGVKAQANRKLNLSAAYRFTKSNSDAVASPSNSYNLQADYGRTSATHTFDAFGQFELPFRFSLGSMARASSGQPFNIVVGQDLNGDGQFNDRPTFATDPSRPSVVLTRWGTFDSSPLPGQRTIPFNYGTGPSQFTADLYLSKVFPLGSNRRSPGSGASTTRAAEVSTTTASKIDSRYKLEASISASNVFNIVNRGLPVGTLGSPLFSQSNTVAPGRSIYLQGQFSF